jgi:catechol 2,3-dioxygenase-like lactoylglutathione lyase family enzyme
MPLNALHHVTVKTPDLETTRDFYRDILGLEVGFRPDLDFPGYWLYAATSRSCIWCRKGVRSAAVHRPIPVRSTISRSSPAISMASRGNWTGTASSIGRTISIVRRSISSSSPTTIT